MISEKTTLLSFNKTFLCVLGQYSTIHDFQLNVLYGRRTSCPLLGLGLGLCHMSIAVNYTK
jgi:hypothetical protein